MKTYIFLGMLLLLPGFADAAIYAKYDGVDGSSVAIQSKLSVQGSLIIESGTLTAGSLFVLDATKSTDDGTIRNYSWKQVSGPQVSIANARTSSISVVPTAGAYVFEVVVMDANNRPVETRRFEVTASAPATSAGTNIQTAPQEAGGDVFIKIDTIKGESSEPKKGNVEFEWKVEEGESAAVPGVEPDEIDYDGGSQPTMPDFSILLGGGTTEAGGAEAAQDVFVTEAMAADSAIQAISFSSDKITAKIQHKVKLFGFIPKTVTATVAVDQQANVDVDYPWWTVFASGKDSKGLGARVVSLVSNVLKTKHDTLKNSIGNVR